MLAKFVRPSHATVVAYLALFIALGGVSYAAVVLPSNSVGTQQIKPGAVKASDLGKNAVKTGNVKNGSLLSSDFKPGQLPAVAPGAPGPQGATGAQGTPGAAGAVGAVGAAGTPGAVRAYGVMKSDGTLVAQRSKGVTISKLALFTGQYCINPTAASGIDPTRTTIVAMADNSDGNGSHHIVQGVSLTLSTTPVACPDGFFVTTQNLYTGTGAHQAENVAVSFLLP